MTRVTGPNGLTIDVSDVVAEGLLRNRVDYRDAGPIILGDGRTPADTVVPAPRTRQAGSTPAGQLNEVSFTGPDGPPKKVAKPRGKDPEKWLAYAGYKGVIVPEGSDVDTIKQLIADKETADADTAAAATGPADTDGAGDGTDANGDGDEGAGGDESDDEDGSEEDPDESN